MSMHDTEQMELGDNDIQAGCDTPDASACGLGENDAPDFKISVRKIQTKVQARGVLAE